MCVVRCGFFLSRQDRVVRMLLINTQYDTDVQINVEMIDRGFAEVCSEPIQVNAKRTRMVESSSF